MGCDIHLYVEEYDVIHDHWTEITPAQIGMKFFDKWQEKYNRFYLRRNYNLFAMLADVRNGIGVAGVETGQAFNPIFEPRGLPENVSLAIKMKKQDWEFDGHSTSFVTLEEWYKYDLTQKRIKKVWVKDNAGFKYSNNINTFSLHYKVGKPTNRIEEAQKMFNQTGRISNAYIEDMVPFFPDPTEYKSFDQYDTYADFVPDEFTHTVRELTKYASNTKKQLCQIRFVFWFDN